MPMKISIEATFNSEVMYLSIVPGLDISTSTFAKTKISSSLVFINSLRAIDHFRRAQLDLHYSICIYEIYVCIHGLREIYI